MVAATLEPLAFRSQAMERGSTCGNMAETWAILVGSTSCPALRLLPLAFVEVPDDEETEGLLRNQRMAKKPTRATAMICGRLMEVCVVSAMVGGVLPDCKSCLVGKTVES